MSFKLLFLAIYFYDWTGKAHAGSFPPLCFNWSSPAPENVSGKYDLIESSCLGGDAALLSTGLWLSYNVTYADPEGMSLGKLWVDYGTSPSLNDQRNAEEQRNISRVEYFLNQPEHGGGSCHCLTVYFSDNCDDSTDVFGKLCDGSASFARKMEIIWTLNNANFTQVESDGVLKDPPFQWNCSGSQTRLHINFSVITGEAQCDPLEDYGRMFYGEGIELAIRFSSLDEWIPIMYLYIDGDNTSSTRGYRLVRREQLFYGSPKFLSVDVCGFNMNDTFQIRWLQSSFVVLNINHPRDIWSLDNVRVYIESNNSRQNVLEDSFENTMQSNINWKPDNTRNGKIDNVCSGGSNAMVFGQNSINLVRNETQYSNNSRSLLTQPIALGDLPNMKELEDGPITASPTAHYHMSTSAMTIDTVVTSSAELTVPGIVSIGTMPTVKTSSTNSEISASIEIKMSEILASSSTIDHLDTNFVTSPSPTTSESLLALSSTKHPDIDSISISETPVALITPDSAGLADLEAIMSVEREALRQILEDNLLREIYNTANIPKRLALLQNATSGGPKLVVAITYLLYDTVTSIQSDSNVDNSLIENMLQIVDAVISLTVADISNLSDTSAAIVGTSLLLVIDEAALWSTQQIYATSNIILNVKSSGATSIGESITTIDTSALGNFSPPHSSLEVPQKGLKKLYNNETLITQATILRNVLSLFPEEIQLENERFRLVSDVVGTSIRCGTSNCPTNNLNLKSPILIEFQHSKELMESLNSSWTTSCVFLNIPKRRSFLNLGRWSSRGCQKNLKLSSKKLTVCECDHLTHFAILLSPSPPDFSPSVELSLSIIGYVGVAVSVVAMVLTVLTFIFLKSLYTMRNFITANLCITLSVAQVLFVTGVNRTGSEAGTVLLQCQIIAVLLHYLFLVSFMWMLMEGVFLYLTLVKVFVQHTKHYLVAFMLICYGGPILYMGALTLPLGFALDDSSSHYGYDRACFLRPDTYFIWAFIAPVILIFLANMGFFIMAGVIMWKHQKKQRDKNRFQQVCNWLRSALSLVVIMGLTWILGLLVVELDELAPLAYLYTIMVAFQGSFIFLVYIIFSKVVRQAYGKWWKSKVNSSETLSKYFGESHRHLDGKRSKSISKNTASTNGSSVLNKPSLANFSLSTRDSIHLSGVAKDREVEAVKADFSLVIRNVLADESTELLETSESSCKGDMELRDSSCKDDSGKINSCDKEDIGTSGDKCEGKELVISDIYHHKKVGPDSSENKCNSDDERKVSM